MKRFCKKEFLFNSCDKIFLDLPKIFYGASSTELIDEWDLEEGSLPPGVELLNGGIIFGFAPLIGAHDLKFVFTVGHKKDKFQIQLQIKALTEDLNKKPRQNTFTKNNYMQWGFGKNLLDEEGRDQAFYIKIHDLESPAQTNAFEASLKACRDIADQYQNLSLCFSGGVDSTAVLMAFFQAKIPFKIYIWKDKNNLITDSDLACIILEKHNLPYEFVELDVLDFFESGEYLSYCKKYKIFSGIELALHIKFLENTPGIPVLAGEPPLRGFFKTWSENPEGYQFPDYEMRCFERYFRLSGRGAIPCFLNYSPDQTKAFIRAEGKTAFTGLYHRKCLLYKISGWPFNPFYTTKYTGFEKIVEHYREKTGDPWFFDNHFRSQALFERHEAEPRRGCSVDDRFLYFPLDLRDINPKWNMGFSHFLRG